MIACGGDTPPQNSTATAPPASINLTLQTVTTSLSSPVFMTAAPNDNSQLFIVQQGGQIRIFNFVAGSLGSTPFLTLSGIMSGGEQGLLGMAFDPSYSVNRRFYVFYTDNNGDLVLVRYLGDAMNPNLADSSSATALLTIPHPTNSNHNGGMVAFGPDGCLYIGPGDGGSGGDPNNHAQNVNQRLGKLLRLDPNTGGACTFQTTNPFDGVSGDILVWSLGLRNPWRFSFDRQTGDLYIADVGQGSREEVSVSLASNAGRAVNYGWRLMEGLLCFNPSSNCNPGGLILPVLDYANDGTTCAVTGGYVYRGNAIPALRGTYFYADFCAGWVRSFRFQGGQATEQTEWPLLSPPGRFVTSFGEDAQGELYVMTQGGGLFKIVAN
ncbi:MAG: PQQ-dependent sugar dehydrogenase [Nitrospiraceae bacterium]